jgi:AhpD family alkylhydroperoxidase
VGRVEPLTPRHDAPRIAPGGRRDIGLVNTAIAAVIGRAAGTGPPNLFTTLSRHRRLYRRWLRFAGSLMPGGRLPRVDTELLILRVAHNCECAYEWGHHVRLGRRAGLSAAEIEQVRSGPDAPGWTARRRVLLRAADELHATRDLTDATWGELREHLDDRNAIELCLLVGHYEMLAMTINALGIQPDH